MFPHARNHSRRVISENSVILVQKLAPRVRQVVLDNEMRSYNLLVDLGLSNGHALTCRVFWRLSPALVFGDIQLLLSKMDCVRTSQNRFLLIFNTP